MSLANATSPHPRSSRQTTSKSTPRPALSHHKPNRHHITSRSHTRLAPNTHPVKGLCVLQVLPRLKADGGVEASTLECTEALVNHSNTSLVAAADGVLKAPLLKLGARVFIMPLDTKNPLKIALNALRLFRLMKRHKPHLVHARSRAPAWSALMASKAAGIPLVTTFHGLYGSGSWLKRLYNSSMVRGKAVVVASRFMARHIQRVYKVPASKIFLNPRGVDLAKFRPVATNKPTTQKTPRATIVMPSRLSPWKGQLLALEALRLMPHPPKIIFLGGGSQSLKAKLQQKAKEFGLTAEFVPATSKPQKVMARGDVILSASSKPEAFGRTPLEAQALGICPVAPASGGALEIITEGENGFLFKPNNAKSLSEALTKALKMSHSKIIHSTRHKAFRHKMAQNAKKFNQLHTGKGYLKFYSLQVKS